MDVRWEALLDPGFGTLPLSWLEGLNEGLPREKRQVWTPQNSGITVREGVVAALEAGWAEFLASREI